MNVVRRVAVFTHGRVLELLLILAVVLLIAQLCWPRFTYWWNLPTPGGIGYDRIDAESLAKTFAIHLPPGYSDNTSWPLVVFLHGSGERGNDPNMLRKSWPFPLSLSAIVAAPQCLKSHSWEPDAVAGFVEHVASGYHVDRDQIYLVGFSMGGYGTWRTAAAHPELFGAIVPICGGGEPDEAPAFANIPVWAFHGEKDDVVPVAESERMIDAIRDTGGRPKLTIVPDAGHGICDIVCRRDDLWNWLLDQRQ